MSKKKSAFNRVPQRSAGKGVVERLNSNGLVFLQQGQFQAGAELLKESLAANPRQPEICYNLGFALHHLGLLDEAIEAYGRAIALIPNDVDALMARGNLLALQKRFDESIVDFSRLVKLAPQSSDAWNNYGNALLESRKEVEALAAYTRALELRASFPQALFNMGRSLAFLGRHTEAEKAYESAIELTPSYEEAKWHLSWAKLALGNYAEGWQLFESRWHVPQLANKKLYPEIPQWLGEGSLKGKSILLYHEQGLGDTLQFCRYIPLLQEMGAAVSLAVQAPLVTLLKAQWRDVVVADVFADSSRFDWATPLMSLPLALGTRLETVPADIPYIHTETPSHKAPIERKRMRAGLVWSGSVAHQNDKNRSVKLETLAPLFELPIDWVCLQPELRESDSVWLKNNLAIHMERPMLTDFTETARIISELDRVVTVDTSVAHLAGAMGKEVWLLLPMDSDYRWLLNREDTPWYPTMRLFRQSTRGDWEGVVKKVVSTLTGF